ncbi:unnamed protein product, partial [Iphiclides podalirius]
MVLAVTSLAVVPASAATRQHHSKPCKSCIYRPKRNLKDTERSIRIVADFVFQTEDNLIPPPHRLGRAGGEGGASETEHPARALSFFNADN